MLALAASAPVPAFAQQGGNGGAGNYGNLTTPSGVGGGTGGTYGNNGTVGGRPVIFGNNSAGGGGGGGAVDANGNGGTGGAGGLGGFNGPAGGTGGAAGQSSVDYGQGSGLRGGQRGGDGSANSGGGGGGGGFYGTSLASGTVVGAIVGGRGGTGGDGGVLPNGNSSVVAGGGGGGAGGFGLILTGSGLSSTNQVTVTGGSGGVGGVGVHGGNGGDGGIGVYFTNAATFTNAGAASVTGGSGGAGGAQTSNFDYLINGCCTQASNGGNPGAAGAGGAGVGGSNVTIINAGTISGGIAGDGVTRANAIVFLGGANALTTNGGSYNGGISTANGATLNLAQTTAAGANQSATYSTTNQFTGAGGLIITTADGFGVTLGAANNYSGGTTITAGSTVGVGDSNAFGTNTVTAGAGTTFKLGDGINVANTLVISGDPFFNQASATSATYSGQITNTTPPTNPGVVELYGGGTLTLSGQNTYSGGTTICGTACGVAGGSSTLVVTNSTAGTSSSIGTGVLTFDGGTLKAGADNLSFNNAVTLTSNNGTIDHNGNNLTWSGAITGAGGLTVANSGTAGTGGLTLTAAGSSYSGATTINGGTLDVEGSITSSSHTTVNSNGTLTGAGAVGATTIAANGVFQPGNGTSGSFMTVNTSLAFQSGALYLVQVDPTTSTLAKVIGTATLNGGVGATFANTAGYVAKQYTILSATLGRTGTFSSLSTQGLPSGFQTFLSYDPTHAYLDLVLNYAGVSGLNGNQQNVGNAIVGFFNSNGSIPLVFGGLTPAGLTQVSGETATGTQQSTFDAMTQFMGVLTDPTSGGIGNGPAAGATPFAEEIDAANAYAAKDPTRSKSEREAYAAIYRKAPSMAAPFVPSWSVWAAGFGGSQTTDGNATLGSNNTRSSLGAVAVGANYWFSPYTTAGFALAGGGTSFGVANGGTGRSDLFQAGAFIRHTVGPAYFTAALAYGWQDVTTDRTVTIAGIDQLRARFNANAFSGRIEDGYRFVTPWMGVTPYAAGQFTTFDLPAYAEQAVAGANAFALAFAAKSVTATRSEVGVRTDKSWALQDSIFTLRGRFGWAHDYNTDRSIGATFQTLPGASFVVNGAMQSADKALTTASAEVKWRSGFSLAGTFEGEFSSNSRSYAGKGVARYQW